MEHQNRGTRKEKTQKEIAAEIGKHPSTISREYKRNATSRGGYNDTKAQEMTESRRGHAAPHNKTPQLLLWRIEQWITDEQWSPAQIVEVLVLAKEDIHISRQTIYNYIHADKSGRLLVNTRHKGKYNRRSKKGKKPTKATNIPDRTSIHERPDEADGSRFGDWEMDLIIGSHRSLISFSRESGVTLRQEKRKASSRCIPSSMPTRVCRRI
ncbi:MAG: IS30 family transposase [Bacteroides sp.]|nr:IS30 family transposase [Bacteroides sp.]